MVREPYLSYRSARLHRLAESIPRNRYLGLLKRLQIRAQVLLVKKFAVNVRECKSKNGRILEIKIVMKKMINVVVKEEENMKWYFGEEGQRRRRGLDRARIFKILRTTGSNPCENQFRRGIDSREGGGGGGTDPKTMSISALKIYIFWDTADSILYIAPTQFQESFFPPIGNAS